MPARAALDAPPPAGCDVVVVGAGIVGLAVARELGFRHSGMRVAVLEREARIAAHQTGSSSGVIHSGIYYRPGSLKARLCVAGAREIYAYCAERGIPAARTGKVVIATHESELAALAELERRGRANDVEGLARIGPGELRDVEPHAAGIAALHSPATGVVDFPAVAAALAADVEASGGTVSTECPVERIRADGSGAIVRHSRGETRATAVVTCAGGWSDRLAVSCGAPADPRIVPFRGAYMRLRPERRGLVRASIYPVPDPELPFLGMHLTRTIEGEVMAGPTALMAGARDPHSPPRARARDLTGTVAWPGTWRMLAAHAGTAVRELRTAVSRRAFAAEARRLVPELRPGDLERGPAGVRAQAVSRTGELVDDFVVHATERALHVRNAPSPAATACLALAREIADRLEAIGDLSTPDADG